MKKLRGRRISDSNFSKIMAFRLSALLTLFITTTATIVLKNPRIRRHTDSIHHLDVDGMHLELKRNSAIQSAPSTDCKFYNGRVLNEDLSIASVTDCSGQLYGLLQTSKDEFVLQPNQADGTHMLRRRDASLLEQPEESDLTGDTVDDLELDYDNMVEPELSPWNHSDIDYFVGPKALTKSLSDVNKFWIDIDIVADQTLLKFHGRERLSDYVMAIMNIVSTILNDVTLGWNLTLVIHHLLIYEEEPEVFGLDLVNSWNRERLKSRAPGSPGADCTIWMTKNMFKGPVRGYATKDGICKESKSAAIVRDEGLVNTAFVVAHEIAHLIGVEGHDGVAKCEKYNSISEGSVMNSVIRTNLKVFFWSECSKEQLHRKIRNKLCLHQRSVNNGTELHGVEELFNYGNIFTMDYQCHSAFGEGYVNYEKSANEMDCSLLKCSHPKLPDRFISKKDQPIDGTPCGPKHWCVKGVCEAKPKWSEWSKWSRCTSGCGYGLRFSHRSCRNKGVRVEKGCDGPRRQLSTCWSGVACATFRDIRTDACYRKDARLIPYIPDDESERCKTWCIDINGGKPLQYGNLTDGAPCSYEKPFDVCYQGSCVSGQCSVRDPSCNWCPDGNCNHSMKRRAKVTEHGWTRMTMIPHEARLVSIRIKTTTPLFIALKGKKEKTSRQLSDHTTNSFAVQNNDYFRYDPYVPQTLRRKKIYNKVFEFDESFGSEGRVVSAGTLVKWRQTDYEVVITAESRLQMDLLILANPKIRSTHHRLLPLPIFVDMEVNYSTPAGTGRVTMEFEWKPDEWEECSDTCGDFGVQGRQVFCVPAKLSNTTRQNLVRNSVSPALCKGAPPRREQPCNRLPCPVYWQENPWTPCSATCGYGVSIRSHYCPAVEDFYCGPKPKVWRRRCRIRRCQTCPGEDTLHYCSRFPVKLLKKLCKDNTFRRNCCNACRRSD